MNYYLYYKINEFLRKKKVIFNVPNSLQINLNPVI